MNGNHRNGNHENGQNGHSDLDPPPVTIGTKIKQARLAAGLTRAQLGDKVKVSAKTIENWEGDQSEPPLKRLKALGSILDVPLQEFFDEIEDENGNGAASRNPEVQRAQQDEEVRRTAQKLARLLGGRMVFGASVAAEAEAVELIGAAEFDALRRVVENRGATSAAVPSRVKALNDALADASEDELREVAEAKGVALFECAPPDGETKGDEVQCAVQGQLVLGALNYPDLLTLTFDEGVDLAKRVSRVDGGKGEFGEFVDPWDVWSDKAKQEWLNTARPLLARKLVAAFIAGKGMLPKEGATAPASKSKKAAEAKPRKRGGNVLID